MAQRATDGEGTPVNVKHAPIQVRAWWDNPLPDHTRFINGLDHAIEAHMPSQGGTDPAPIARLQEGEWVGLVYQIAGDTQP